MSRPPTSLSRHLGESSMDEDHVRDAARAAYRKRSVIVFLPDDLKSMPEMSRRLIYSEAERIYGKGVQCR
jgi:hypothetical protein